MNTVHFQDVGRDKQSWSANLKSVSEDTLVKEVRRRGALCSRNVDCEINDMGSGGVVIVGGWRAAGRFTIAPKQTA